eukprot:9587937-Alexandrium_andersonii.AAC.1
MLQMVEIIKSEFASHPIRESDFRGQKGMFSEAAAEALQALASVAPWPITYIKTAEGGVDEICL